MAHPLGPQQANAQRALRGLLVLWIVFATHGSLYPWQFEVPVSLSQAWGHMVHQGGWWTTTGDVVGNVVLFAPGGALGWALLHATPQRRGLRAIGLLAIAMAFAFVLQLVQLFIPARDAQVSDVVWNMLGLLIGMVVGLRLPSEPLARLGASPVRVPIAMALFWLALQWWPLSPVLSRDQIATALRPLWGQPQWAAFTALQAAFSLTVLALMLRHLRPRVAIVWACVVLALIGKVVTIGQALSISHGVGCLIGMGLAVWAWRLPVRPMAALGAGVALLYLAVKAMRALEPLDADVLGRWLPPWLHATAATDALAWGWMAYWLLAALILLRETRRTGYSPARVRINPPGCAP